MNMKNEAYIDSFKVKVSDLPAGRVVWKGNDILGVTNATLPEKYNDNYCIKLLGNGFDYELIED